MLSNYKDAGERKAGFVLPFCESRIWMFKEIAHAKRKREKNEWQG